MYPAQFAILLLSALSLSFLPYNDSFRPKALVLPVTKDPSTNQYVIEIRHRTPLVPVKVSLDLGGPFLWVDCANYKSSTWKPARCGSAQCNLARSKSCVTQCFSPPRPGCTNNTCGLNIDNRWIKTSSSGSLGMDTVEMQSRNGPSAGRNVSTSNILFGCGESPVLPGLTNGATGVAGFGRSKVSFPYLLSSAFSFPKKFAICLNSGRGVIFFGGGPYKLGYQEFNFNKIEGHPLILNPESTAGAFFKGDPSTDYFINVRGIRINDKTVRLNSTLLGIDGKGNGGTMLSTVVPYTVMESSIYSAVEKAFREAMKVPVVRAVAPFTLCFNSGSLFFSRVGWTAPQIKFVLSNGGSWVMVGWNSMKSVSDDVVCLAMVDGGKNPRTSIVIGSYQMQDSLIEFDLAQSKLRLFTPLPALRTTCSSFNFTSNLQV